MSLSLYADECVDGRIVAGLRRRKIDVVTAGDEGLLGAPDEEQLVRAVELRRAIVTTDHDFLRLAQTSSDSPGVIFILPGTRVGDAVRAITVLATVLSASDMQNWIEWVS